MILQRSPYFLWRICFLATFFVIPPCILIGSIRAETLVVRVAADSDTAEEILDITVTRPRPNDPRVLGGVYIDSTDLELGTDYRNAQERWPQMVGIRFLNVTIPAGSTINSASIQFTADEEENPRSGPHTASFDIFGELSLAPETYLDSYSNSSRQLIQEALFNISSRTQTTNSAQWLDVPTWAGQVGDAGPDQRTPDLSAIVQEMIDQPGWDSGGAVAFQISPVGNILGPSRVAESFRDGRPPVLLIDFTPIPEPSSVVLVSLATAAAFMRRRRCRSFC